MKLTDKKFWEQRWRGQADAKTFEKVHPGIMPFHPLFEKILPKDRSFVEVGCSPGRNLVYFNRYFNYRVAGIDFAAAELVRQTLASNGIDDYDVYDMDFLEKLPPKKFDVVGSFGFVEHFTDLEEVLARHVALVNEGGLVVVGVPNFRWAQYLIRLVLDRDTLKHHNVKATKCAAIRKILAGLGARRIIYSGYYKTFKFWTDREDLPGAVLRGISLFDAGFQKAARLIRADNIPTPFFSPYSVTVAQF
jgi:SAM-dependent methyltransferase